MARHASNIQDAVSARTGCGVRDVIAYVSASMASATRLTVHVPALQDIVGSIARNHVLLDFMAKTAEKGEDKCTV